MIDLFIREGEQYKKVGTIELDVSQAVPQRDYSLAFEAFWRAYPRRTAKGGAWKAWQRIKVIGDVAERIIAAVELNKRSNPQWLKDGGQYIPYPATWLNERRWEDELRVDSLMTPRQQARCRYDGCGVSGIPVADMYCSYHQGVIATEG